MSDEEKTAVALAYVFDHDVVLEAIQRSDAFNDAYTVVEDSAGLDPAARERALAVLAQARDRAAAEVERLEAAIGGGEGS